ncbi:MAG: hypothetical protein SFU56_15290 [Capsulimonadales bacterium]|nr:hypothetical protein [Capsulimonadales bacterium]
MRQRTILGLALCLTVFATGAGCGRKSKETASSKPTPTPPPLSATSTGLSVSVYDSKGDVSPSGALPKVLDLKSRGAGASTGAEGETVVVSRGSAVLYQEGKASATLTADRLAANREERTVVATGNVVATSLSQPRAPAVRADKMVWTHDRNLLTGNGNVVMTARPDFVLHGRSFTADTKLSRYRVKMGQTPSSGTL